MNNDYEILIEQKIAKTYLTLDLHGSDRKMLQLACKDFVSYMKLNCKTTYGKDVYHLEKVSEAEMLEIESFLNVWVGKWMEKWQERVKLLIGKQGKNEFCHDLKTLEKVEPLWRTLECKTELTEIAQAALISKGEICGSELLAEHAIKMELASNTFDVSDRNQALTLLCNVMHRANEIAKNKGPLLFVEINKSYYASSKPASIKQ